MKSIKYLIFFVSFLGQAYGMSQTKVDDQTELQIKFLEATFKQDIPVVKECIEKGVNINARPQGYCATALHLAILNGNTELTKLLLPQADLAAQVYESADAGSRGLTPLLIATKEGLEEISLLIIKECERYGVKMADIINQKSYFILQDTALHRAVEHGLLTVVEALLAHGADFNAVDKHGYTPLMRAIIYGRGDYTAVVHKLLAAGADTEKKVSSDHPQDWETENATALIFAAKYGREEAAKALLARGAQANAKNGAGYTALHNASKGGYTAIISLLLQAGANVNAISDVSATTPLVLAARYGHPEVVKLLLAAQANVSLCEENGNSALHSAAGKGPLEIVKLLLAAKANPNVATKSNYWGGGELPIERAALGNHADIVVLLVPYCSALTLLSVLDRASCSGKIDTVKVLLKGLNTIAATDATQKSTTLSEVKSSMGPIFKNVEQFIRNTDRQVTVPDMTGPSVENENYRTISQILWDFKRSL